MTRMLEIGQRLAFDVTSPTMWMEPNAHEIVALALDLHGASRIIGSAECTIEGQRHLAERDRFGSNEPAQRANPATLADDVDVLGSTLDLEPHHQLLHGFALR